MASPMLVKVACLGLMCMVLSIPLADGAIPCGQVQFTLASCLGYLRGGGGAVPPACCNGVRTLNNQAKTTPDRRGVCTCLKSSVLRLPGINFATATALSAKCGVNLPYKISPAIDCNIVH
ncbi:hypothetical protein VNO77_20736 [Canavalia gladiata]|uniref:Non-specific lipid-transfer protein n=1 Tax=Canavalia gladiata TaxID=3824 RepID=A0AAN9LTA8_CANGL